MIKRGKGRIQGSLTTRDMYKAFKKDYPKGSPFHLEYRAFADLNKEFLSRVKDYILDGGEFKMPYRLGALRIKKRKQNIAKKLAIDFKTSKEIKKLTFHMNEHSSEYIYRWYWNKKIALVKGKSAYSFIPCRAAKRELAKLIKEENKDYFE